jgi:hypothetical protein
MTMVEDASAMTEASGTSGDEARIDHAAEAIRDMTKEMVQELPPPRPRLSEKLRQFTMEAPLHSIAIAFLFGVLIARRR